VGCRLQEVFDVGYGTVVDSGTTFTYIPTRAYKAFYTAIAAAAASSGLQLVGGADPLVRTAPSSELPRTCPAVRPPMHAVAGAVGAVVRVQEGAGRGIGALTSAHFLTATRVLTSAIH
jgi:hypothetical protein